MPHHAIALGPDRERSHAILQADTMQDAASAVRMVREFRGKALRAIHTLPDTLTPFLNSVGVRERIKIHADYFTAMLREFFAQGKSFMDRQASDLPPFVPAETLLADHEAHQWEGNIPQFDACKNSGLLELDLDEVHHYLIGSLEKGMAFRAEEMGGYSYYYATARTGDSFMDLLVSTKSRKALMNHLNKDEPVPLEPFLIHRLSPEVQQYLLMSDQLIEWRKEIEPDEDVPIPAHLAPSVTLTAPQYHRMVGTAFSEGRAMFDGYKDLHPPYSPSQDLVPDGAAADGGEVAAEDCVFNMACKALDEHGKVSLSGNALRSIVRTLLTTGRHRAWKGLE